MPFKNVLRPKATHEHKRTHQRIETLLLVANNNRSLNGRVTVETKIDAKHRRKMFFSVYHRNSCHKREMRSNVRAGATRARRMQTTTAVAMYGDVDDKKDT